MYSAAALNWRWQHFGAEEQAVCIVAEHQGEGRKAQVASALSFGTVSLEVRRVEGLCSAPFF